MLSKLKDFLGVTGFVAVSIFFAVCYLNNLIWTFNNWDSLHFLSIVIQTISVFFFPLGIIMGIIHFF